jgi:GH25 family lysozyme M1 (1,4-beta-N-acetylmuramidase)
MALLNAVIDLSHFNIVTSFHQIKSDGIIGVIHKATQSTRFVDAEYADRRRAALSAGLLFGSYHFAAQGGPEVQADHHLDIAESTDLMVLDFEPNSQEGTMTLCMDRLPVASEEVLSEVADMYQPIYRRVGRGLDGNTHAPFDLISGEAAGQPLGSPDSGRVYRSVPCKTSIANSGRDHGC